MSADNGVYIVKFPDGYRVAHAQAIENIDYFPEGTKERREELKNYFGESKIYSTYEEANKVAHKKADEIINDEDGFGFGILEYGVCYLGEYESFN